eukprot:TRINITY_DN893_c2_g1_i6.p1 TRINITY_DN893_c2_g1~~TRINITY_DN893_c2_g1_i6.p1  ORF type:complete len:786 (-),score=176.92 TRINITY_DN893_c2_g1_i6:59-2416(-)
MKPQIIRRSLAQSEEHLTRDDDFQTGITFGRNTAPVPTESTDSNYSDDNQDIDIRISEDFSPISRSPRTPGWDPPSSPLVYYASDSEYGSHSYPYPPSTSHYPPPPPYFSPPTYTHGVPPPLYHPSSSARTHYPPPSVPHPSSPSYPPYYHHQSSPPGYGTYSPYPPYSYPPPLLPRATPAKSRPDDHSLVIEFAKLGLACLPSPSTSSPHGAESTSKDLESELVAQLRELISSRVASTRSSAGSRGRKDFAATASEGRGVSGGVDIVVGEVDGAPEGDRSRSPLSQDWKGPSPPSSSSTSAASADAAGKSHWTKQTQAATRANNRRRSTSTPAHRLSAVGGARLGSNTNGKETRLSATGPTKVAHKKLLGTPSPPSPHPTTRPRIAHSPSPSPSTTPISPLPSSSHSAHTAHATSQVSSSLSPSSSSSSSYPYAADLAKMTMYGNIAHIALEYIVDLLSPTSSEAPERERERERVRAMPRSNNPNEAVIMFPVNNSEMRQSNPAQSSYSPHHLRTRSHSTGHSGAVKSRNGRGSGGGSRSRQSGARASGGSRKRSPPLNRTTDTQSGYAKPKLRRWNSSSETALVSLEDETDAVMNHKWGENESDYSVDSELVRMSKPQKRSHENRGRVHKTLRQVPAPVPAAMLSPNYDPRPQHQQQSHQGSYHNFSNYPPSTYSSYPPPPLYRTSYATPHNPYAYTHSPPPPEVGRSTYTPPQIYHQISEPTYHSKDTHKPFPERGSFTFANDSTEESTESSSSTPNHSPPHSPHNSHSPSPNMRRRLKKAT